MNLKLRRTQRSAGMMNKKIYFALDARADLTAEERSLVEKYGLGNTVVYDSEARKAHAGAVQDHFADAREASGGRSLWKTARGLASAAMAAMTLRITVGSLISGQHVECKDLDELLGAEAAIMEGCRNLKAYLETALTFDGREEVLEF
jgi:hypothetical protein